jgi:hypothetical protein
MPQLVAPSRHFSDTMLSAYRLQTDSWADSLVAQTYQTGQTKAIHDLIQNIESLPQIDIPTFAEESLMNKGFRFFKEHQNNIGLLLGCLSLPYCYAAADGAMVLYLSERLRTDTWKRLQETAEFVFGIMNPQEWQTGRAQQRIVQVRFTHAMARMYAHKSGRWNMAWGQPINQEDMAGTNLAFSYIVIKGLRKMNKNIDPNDAEGFLHLWNVVGYMNGVNEELLPKNLREAFRLDQAIASRQFRASEVGVALTLSLVKTLEGLVPNPIFKSIPTANMRFLLGDPLADLLQIPALSLEKRVVPFLPLERIFAQAR